MTTPTQAAAGWLAAVAGVVAVFGTFGELLPEAEREALSARLERLGALVMPSGATWATLAAVMRSLHRASDAVGHPVAPLLACWETDLMRERDRAAQPGPPGDGGAAWRC
jgi:hypothetical protein